MTTTNYGTRPYQPIPFQWSNHIETVDGKLRHEAYLCPDARDPREELTFALLKSVGEQGSTCTCTERRDAQRSEAADYVR